jgi:hypothetical protein
VASLSPLIASINLSTRGAGRSVSQLLDDSPEFCEQRFCSLLVVEGELATELERNQLQRVKLDEDVSQAMELRGVRFKAAAAGPLPTDP